jgi:hypothetical protein
VLRGKLALRRDWLRREGSIYLTLIDARCSSVNRSIRRLNAGVRLNIGC